MHQERGARLKLALLLAGLLFCAPAFPQSITRAAISGRVMDHNQQPLPGVMVGVSSKTAALQPQSTVSGADGEFRVPFLLPANDYELVLELPGFSRVEVGPLHLNAGRTTVQDVTMVPEDAGTDTVTVDARGRIVDTATTKTATVFNYEFIESIPLRGRLYQDVLTLAPGVMNLEGFENPSVNGSGPQDFQTRLDGANITDPATGTSSQNLTIESLAELEVITSGAPAEFSQAQGGFGNIVTKSGGNNFQVSFKMFFGSDLFDGDGANNNDVTGSDLAPPDGFTDTRGFLSLGGPIVRDRLWYFLAGERILTDVPVNALEGATLSTQEGWNIFGKLTFQPSPSHRVVLAGVWDPREVTGLGLGFGIPEDSGFSWEQGGTNVSALWTWNASPSMLLELMAARLDTGVDLTPASDPGPCETQDIFGEEVCDPFKEDLYRFDLVRGTTMGPYYVTSQDERTRDSLRVDLSFFVEDLGGTHSLKTGIEASREEYGGEMEFRDLRFDDVDAFGGGPFGTIHFGNFFPSSFGGTCSPTSVECVETSPLASKKDSIGLYVQDSYKPRPNLTLNFGLRLDREEITAPGWEYFEPSQEGGVFLERALRGSGRTLDEILVDRDGEPIPLGLAYTEQLQEPRVRFDVNGDGRDDQHCRIGLDVFNNASVTDFIVNENGTYTLVGDPTPDGIADNFFTFLDGDLDGTANFGDPDDLVAFFPGGGAPLADGTARNPNCDRFSEDIEFLFAGFARHQFDLREGPIFFPRTGPDPRLPGTTRDQETFSIVNHNLAPRLGISWDPWSNNRTKLFASWSRFYNTLYLASVTPEQGPDLVLDTYDASDIPLGALATPIATGRFSTTQVDRDLKTPFTDELTVGFERELASEWSLGLMYIRREGRDQLQAVDVNHFVLDADGDGALDDDFGKFSSGGFGTFRRVPDGMPDQFVWNPLFGSVLRVGNFNSSTYESVQLVLTRRLSHMWQMNASYAYSKARTDGQRLEGSLGVAPGTQDSASGFQDFDQRHVLKLNGVAFLRWAQRLGWGIEWGSGLPYSRILVGSSCDVLDVCSVRTTYPTGERNDHRNEGTWLINAAYWKDFTFGPTQASIGVEVRNLLNEDNLRIVSIDDSRPLGMTAFRDFGRRWQLSFALQY